MVRSLWSSRFLALVPLVLAGLLMFTFATFPPVQHKISEDADVSSSAVLNYASQQGLQFGRDIVFTYGPLGYLFFFYYSPHLAGLRLAVDVAFCFTVAAGLCLLAWRLGAWRGFLILGLFVWVASNLYPRMDLVFEMGFLCWGLLCFVESGRRLRVAVLAFTALAVFGALAKVSFLFAGCLSVALLAGDLLARGERRLSWMMPSGFGAGFLAGWLAAGQNPLHLGAYVVNAFAVTSAYNQALGWEGLQLIRFSGFVLAPLIIAVILLRTLTAFGKGDAHRHWRRGLLLAWISLVTFIDWKHGFVRADFTHAGFFFVYVAVLALALDVLPTEQRTPGTQASSSRITPSPKGAQTLACRIIRSPPLKLLSDGLAVACCLLAIVALQDLCLPALPGSLAQPFHSFSHNASRLLNAPRYFRTMNQATAENRQAAQLPRVREIVGRESIGSFGQYPIYILANDLNYRPSPLFQSYTACTERLMALNEQFYLSPAAPAYVLFWLTPPEHKFPPLEDARVLRDLLFNYQPVATEAQFLLLKATASDQPRLTLLRAGTVQPGEPIDLRAYGEADLWLVIKLDLTWLGRAQEFLYRPPIARLAAWREPAKGLLCKRRAPPAALEAGFLGSPLLLRNEDVLNLYTGNTVTHPGAYSVELNNEDARLWRQAIHYRIFRIENRLGRCLPRDWQQSDLPALK